ncbi:phosphotriesterase family protein [Streptomyces sp. NPDC058256]|uniref:phosphotriesterase family protein n=1 Tax=Streptomyces sp. NPDC058256 TaxID=3346408 RepID=UPI0036E80A7D
MIETVLGPVDASALGPTSMHEHLLSDARVLHRPPREPIPADPRVTPENLGFLRWNLLALQDNLVLDDPDTAVTELAPARELGQSCVVDLTSWGLGPRHAELPALSQASGLHIAAGYGAYLGRSHPDWLRALDETALEEHLHRALTDHIPGVSYRAALLGIIGTGAPVDPAERRMLRAAGRAAARCGATVSVRLDPGARLGFDVLQVLASAGLPAERVVLGNVDEYIDPPYLRELASVGATLEWCFGNEAYYRDGYKDATDAERLDAVEEFLADGFADRMALGCSVWTKTQLRRYGGMGYDHLLRRIVPALRDRGIPQKQLDTMLVDVPRRLLDRTSPTH